ncbi:MAG: hypothetical protein H0U74_02540 [Bradymonadaceae bacterium]|nr:hypothetical protein [Lujinxingiaceae bacterium]
MPIFGDSFRFAVEFELDEDYFGVWMYGRFCYWCAGRRIGDFDLSTSLRDVLFQLDRIAFFSGERNSNRFSHIPASEVFRLLFNVLYDDGELVAEGIAEEEQWARHEIVPAVDIFGGLIGFLVENQSIARVVFSLDPFQEIIEAILEPGEVDAILDAVRLALDEIYERERKLEDEPSR